MEDRDLSWLEEDHVKGDSPSEDSDHWCNKCNNTGYIDRWLNVTKDILDKNGMVDKTYFVTEHKYTKCDCGRAGRSK